MQSLALSSCPSARLWVSLLQYSLAQLRLVTVFCLFAYRIVQNVLNEFLRVYWARNSQPDFRDVFEWGCGSIMCHTYFLCASAFLFSSLSTSSLHWWLDWTVTSSCYITESLLSYSKGWLTVAYCLDMLGVRLQTKRSWVLLLVDTQDNDPGAPVIKRCSSIPLNGQCCAAGEVVIDLMLYMPWSTD